MCISFRAVLGSLHKTLGDLIPSFLPTSGTSFQERDLESITLALTTFPVKALATTIWGSMLQAGQKGRCSVPVPMARTVAFRQESWTSPDTPLLHC